MQLLRQDQHTSESYVSQQAWRTASLECCPFHPDRPCGLRTLGSYRRVWPAGARIARFWCPVQRASVSLLPAFLAARMTGALDAVEAVVDAVEAAGTVAAAIDAVHAATDAAAIGLVSARRSIERRLRPVRAVLKAAVTMLPELIGCAPTLDSIRRRLDGRAVLLELRRRLAAHLQVLAPPVGFGARFVA